MLNFHRERLSPIRSIRRLWCSSQFQSKFLWYIRPTMVEPKKFYTGKGVNQLVHDSVKIRREFGVNIRWRPAILSALSNQQAVQSHIIRHTWHRWVVSQWAAQWIQGGCKAFQTVQTKLIYSKSCQLKITTWERESTPTPVSGGRYNYLLHIR